MPNKRTLMIMVVGIVLLAVVVSAITSGKNNGEVEQPPIPNEQTLLLETTPQAKATQTMVPVIPTQSITWDCEWINATTAQGYNPNLPTIPNAFRAILAAGDPTVWEPGPFKFIDSTGVETYPESRDEMHWVHNGDQVCVIP